VKTKIIIATLIIIIASLVALLFLPYQIVEYPTHLTVTAENVGVNVDTDALWFGHVPVGGSSARPIVVASSQKSFVKIKAEGELAKWLIVSENNFKLMPDNKKEVMIKLDVPSNAEITSYEGTLSVYFYRPLFR
jgi:hypothetical protein